MERAVVAFLQSSIRRPAYAALTMPHSTNYYDVFITAAPDCVVVAGTTPRQTARPSVALRTFEMIRAAPYELTSDDVVFGVYAERKEIPKRKRAAARREFFFQRTAVPARLGSVQAVRLGSAR